MRLLFLLSLLAMTFVTSAQPDRWQQGAEYVMDIDFDVKKHQFKGKQTLTYYNNSPDTLDRVFYHLYFNAFQPGSMMDVRARSIKGGSRIGDRIKDLKPEDQGFHKISSLTMDGRATDFEVVGTILEVNLPTPILPKSKVVFQMEFDSQVPVQIRRSGRYNAEGVAYSMTQWYPKMCEYDYQGWHANPYIGREFYGIWGDFDVTIHIDKNFVIGGTGYLQNPQEIGHGYEDNSMKMKRPKGDKLHWHFKAPNVHDFAWGADRDYIHVKQESEAGLMMHFFYKKNISTKENWEALPDIMNEAFLFLNKTYGKYPYDQYSFIQGGDGGMEYPMATLITGERALPSLVGVSVHELLHMWYYGIMATNEALYPWMDEGFTSYASDETMNHLRKIEALRDRKAVEDPHAGDIRGFVGFAKSGYEEPLITHADHFKTNSAYGVGSYTKGALFLVQLKYIIGDQAFNDGMLRYYNTWKFKHPNYNDFIRVMEKESGLELDWYKEYWIHTTDTIDYGVKGVIQNGVLGSSIQLFNNGTMPMPLDVEVTFADGSTKLYNIPLQIMRGHKPAPNRAIDFAVAEDWPWTHPTYELAIDKPKNQIKKVVLDPNNQVVDVNDSNDIWQAPRRKKEERKK